MSQAIILTSFNQVCICLEIHLNTRFHTLVCLFVVWLCQQEQGMKSPSAVSNQWGSYFVDVHRSGGGDEENQKLTWCCHCTHKYSTMAIPSVEHIAGMWKEDIYSGFKNIRRQKKKIQIWIILICNIKAQSSKMYSSSRDLRQSWQSLRRLLKDLKLYEGLCEPNSSSSIFKVTVIINSILPANLFWGSIGFLGG